MKNLCNYHFNVEHGMSGNLAKDPEFKEDSKGNEYAKVTLYCVPMTSKEEKKGNLEPALIVYVKILDPELFDQVETLKTGDLVNFLFEQVTIGIGNNNETDEREVIAFITAHDFEVRYKAQAKKSTTKKRHARDKKSANPYCKNHRYRRAD